MIIAGIDPRKPPMNGMKSDSSSSGTPIATITTSVVTSQTTGFISKSFQAALKTSKLIWRCGV